MVGIDGMTAHSETPGAAKAVVTSKTKSWMKILQELEPISRSQKLHEMLYKLLRRAPEFTPEKAEEFKEEQELLSKILLAHADFQSNPPYSHEGYGDMFGEYLTQTEQLNDRAGQFFTPMNIVRAMCEMCLNPQVDEEPQYISDPAAGCGRFMLKTAEIYQKKIGAYNFLFHNVDIDYKMYVYCTMNAILYAIPSVNIWGDSLAPNGFREGFLVLQLPSMPVQWHYLDREAVQKFQPKFKRQKMGLEKFVEGDAVIPERPKRARSRDKETPVQKTLLG